MLCGWCSAGCASFDAVGLSRIWSAKSRARGARGAQQQRAEPKKGRHFLLCLYQLLFLLLAFTPCAPGLDEPAPGPCFRGEGGRAIPSGEPQNPFAGEKNAADPSASEAPSENDSFSRAGFFPGSRPGDSPRRVSARARPRLLYQIMFELRAVRSRHLYFCGASPVFYFLRRFAGFIWTIRPGRFALVYFFGLC